MTLNDVYCLLYIFDYGDFYTHPSGINEKEHSVLADDLLG